MLDRLAAQTAREVALRDVIAADGVKQMRDGWPVVIDRMGE